jgi:hypothetical protein
MRLYPSLERSVGELHALEWINGDGYRHNVFVRWPDGTIARPVTWLWQDIYSRKILAWRTDHTENSDLIRLALADLIEHWGVPEHATLDNTRAAANKWLSGGTPTRYRFKVRPEDPLGILPRLGIQVHWTSVQAGKGWGQAKPIERAFGVGGLSEYIDKDPAFRGAWTGPDPTAKPENYNSRAVDLQTFEAVLADRLAVWNSQPGRRTEICQGRLSFDEAFSASYSRSTIRKASSAQRRLLLLAAESVRVDNTGAVALDFGVGQVGRGGRNRYADEALLAYSGAWPRGGWHSWSYNLAARCAQGGRRPWRHRQRQSLYQVLGPSRLSRQQTRRSGSRSFRDQPDTHDRPQYQHRNPINRTSG